MILLNFFCIHAFLLLKQASGAVNPLGFLIGPFLDPIGSIGEGSVQLAKAGTRLVFLAEGGQRQAQFQQDVRRFRSCLVFLVGIEEDLRRTRELPSSVIGLGEPVPGIVGQRVVGIGFQEIAEAGARFFVVPLLQERKGARVLLSWRLRC